MAFTVDTDSAGRFREATGAFQTGPPAWYMPCLPRSEAQIKQLASLKPRACAPMHGSTFLGNGEKALLDMAVAMKELLG
jgi:hypothetical protein